MDLLRAVVIGPSGTPYHDGLFFFDCCFPSTYPNTPPVLLFLLFLVSFPFHHLKKKPKRLTELQMVHYHSGGLRLNPNLYASGKVCLSLLGTWAGDGCERWKPKESTMLQVLVSIQGLILNSEPYFNEPGFELTKDTVTGATKSSNYNEQTFLLSCKTMLYSIRSPPKASFFNPL